VILIAVMTIEVMTIEVRARQNLEEENGLGMQRGK
jgi:hypothetical protein